MPPANVLCIVNDGTRLSALATAASTGDSEALEALVRLLWGYADVTATAAGDDPSARLDLEAAIGRLPDSLRLPLELHYFMGLNSREIATALGVPAATVRFRLMLARRRLRPLLCDSTASSTALEVVS